MLKGYYVNQQDKNSLGENVLVLYNVPTYRRTKPFPILSLNRNLVYVENYLGNLRKAVLGKPIELFYTA